LGGGNIALYDQPLNTTDDVIFNSALIGDVSIIGNGIAAVDSYGNPSSLFVDENLTVIGQSLDAPIHLVSVNDPNTSQYNTEFALNNVKIDKVTGTKFIIDAASDSTTATYSGRAYIADISGTIIHTLVNPNADGIEVDDHFGISCDINGSYAIVGAYRETNSAAGQTDKYNAPGHAYVFDVSTGGLVHSLVNPDAASTGWYGDRFGSCVAINGDYAVVGSMGEYISGTPLIIGKLFVYSITGGTTPLYTINNPSVTQSLGFASPKSITISNTYIVVSDRYHDASFYGEGVVYIYDISSGTLLHTINNPNPSNYDTFGLTVAINGADILITSASKAYIFDAVTGNLKYTLSTSHIPNAASQNFGYSCDLSNNFAVITSIGLGIGQGALHIYDATNGSFIQQYTETSTIYRMGYSTSVYNNTCIVGTEGILFTSLNKVSVFDITKRYSYDTTKQVYGNIVTGDIQTNTITSNSITTNTLISDSSLIGDVSIIGNTIAGLDTYGLADTLIVDGDLNITGNLVLQSTTATPVDSATVVKWAIIEISGQTYYTPLYQ